MGEGVPEYGTAGPGEGEDMRTVIVLAGTHLEFERYRGTQFNPGIKFVYGDHPCRLAGFRADALDTVGTFWERSDANDLYDFAKSRLNN